MLMPRRVDTVNQRSFLTASIQTYWIDLAPLPCEKLHETTCKHEYKLFSVTKLLPWFRQKKVKLEKCSGLSTFILWTVIKKSRQFLQSFKKEGSLLKVYKLKNWWLPTLPLTVYFAIFFSAIFFFSHNNFWLRVATSSNSCGVKFAENIFICRQKSEDTHNFQWFSDHAPRASYWSKLGRFLYRMHSRRSHPNLTVAVFYHCASTAVFHRWSSSEPVTFCSAVFHSETNSYVGEKLCTGCRRRKQWQKLGLISN